jgi:type IV pilus assembly protein PilP
MFSVLMIMLPGVCLGAETNVADPAVPVGISQLDQFEYTIEDRKDPFIPFITEKATTSDVNMDEIVETKAVLTGMQLFEPGQLTLVALMKKGARDFAMVEDFTGKGYIISVGTKIGKRGVVKEIIPNQVIIEETAETRAGKQLVNNIVMVLKKEGEE